MESLLPAPCASNITLRLAKKKKGIIGMKLPFQLYYFKQYVEISGTHKVSVKRKHVLLDEEAIKKGVKRPAYSQTVLPFA